MSDWIESLDFQVVHLGEDLLNVRLSLAMNLEVGEMATSTNELSQSLRRGVFLLSFLHIKFVTINIPK